MAMLARACSVQDLDCGVLAKFVQSFNINIFDGNSGDALQLHGKHMLQLTHIHQTQRRAYGDTALLHDTNIDDHVQDGSWL
jgi:hypothetical protein